MQRLSPNRSRTTGKSFDADSPDDEFALALRWNGQPAYERISAFAKGIVDGVSDVIAAGLPLYVMLDGDVAQSLGALMYEELGVKSEVLVIDGVVLWDFDYIDLGKIRLPSKTVPVTIKSLVFSDDPRTSQRLSHEEQGSAPNNTHGPGAHSHGHDHGHQHGDGSEHHTHNHTHGDGPRQTLGGCLKTNARSSIPSWTALSFNRTNIGSYSKELKMAKDAIVSEEMAKKFASEKDTPYEKWVRSEGLDIISAHYVPSLHTVELKPWASRDGKGVFINHEASRTSNDCYVCEIPAGGKLAPRRQLFEEMILVLSGRGSTSVWNDAGQSITFEWQAGALFAIPLNANHQHFNASGQEAARFVAVTNSPPVINLYEDLDFVFNTKHDFKERFAGEPDYFANKGKQDGFKLETNFVADAVNLPLITAKERGAGGGHIRFNMARGSMNSHISQFPIGTYKKGHRHGPGAHVIILNGEGYSLMWPEGEKAKTL